MLGKNKTIILGICGGSGCGKSTFTQKLKNSFNDEMSVLCHDDYYKAHDELSMEKRALLNFDHPDALDTSLLIKHLKALKAGKSVLCPVYDYTIHNRRKNSKEINPNKIIAVEGILIFENADLRKLFDIKIFIDVDSDERVLRRALRDLKLRNDSLEEVARRYLANAKPMHELFVEPYKKFADIIINDSCNPLALKAVESMIKSILESK